MDLVIEAATENLALKQQLFARIEALARPGIPLTSNTSTIPIGAIGEHLKTRSRVAGLHYFMPAHLVPLVEIIRAEHTDKTIVDWLEQNQRELGKEPVRVNKDIPGFLGNRLQHAMMREACIWSPMAWLPRSRRHRGALRLWFPLSRVRADAAEGNVGLGHQFIRRRLGLPHLYAEKTPPQFLKDMVAKATSA